MYENDIAHIWAHMGKSVSWERDNHRHHRQHDNRIDLFQENLHDNCALLDNTNQ